MQDEIWMSIPGAPFYEASTLGRIRSIDRVVTQRHEYGMLIHRRLRGQIIRPATMKNGYQKVIIRVDRKNLSDLVHRLILLTFVGPAPDGMQGCHNDGNQSNNALSNLRWDTVSANMADKKAHGTWNGGLKNPAAKFPDDLIDDIRSGRIGKDEAMDRGVSSIHFYNVKNGRRRAPLSAPPGYEEIAA